MECAIDNAKIVQGRPVLVVRNGRGRTGGSTFLDFLIQRARIEGRSVLVGDGDRRNATLAALYAPGTPGGAFLPKSDETPDVKEWIRGLVSKMAQERVSLVLDLGAGDQALAESCRELDLVEFCEEHEVEPLFLGTMGPDPEDFEHLLTIKRAGFFQTRRVILVLNHNLVRAGKTADGEFDAILERPELEELEGPGFRILQMPRLIYMEKIRQCGLNFYEAAAYGKRKDGRPIDPMWQFDAKKWIKHLEREIQENDVGEWLP
nr:hypothetical protein [Methylocapsa sp. RX1]